MAVVQQLSAYGNTMSSSVDQVHHGICYRLQTPGLANFTGRKINHIDISITFRYTSS